MHRVISKLKNRKKSSLLMIGVLMLSVLTMFSFIIYNDSSEQLKTLMNYQHFGKWQGIYEDKPNNSYEIIGELDIISSINDEMVLGSFDEDMMELANFTLLEGRYPENSNEIIVETTVLDSLNLPYKCSQKIEVTFNGKTQDMNIVGIISPYRMSWINQEYEYPSMITTKMNSDDSLYFVYDSNIKNTTIQEHSFTLLNEYSYPELLSQSDMVFDNTMIVSSISICVGVLLTATIFIQLLLKRKDEFYAMCMIGISNKAMIKESIMEAFIICICAIPLGIVLSILLAFVLLSNVSSSISFISYFNIDYYFIGILTVLLVLLVMVIFVVGTLGMISSWNRNIRVIKKKKLKKTMKGKSIVFTTFAFFLVIVFSSVKMFEDYTQYGLHEYRDSQSSDYVYIQQNTMDGIKDGYAFGNGYNVNGIKDDKIQEMKQIYGIATIDYGYAIPVNLSFSLDSEEMQTVLFSTMEEDRLQLEKRGINLSDEEYQKFIDGEEVFLVFLEDVEIMEGSTADWILSYQDGQNHVIDETVYMNIDEQISVSVSRVEVIKSYENEGNEGMKQSGYFLCSNKFIQSNFDLHDGPYQYVYVNASKEANYGVTDKQISRYGLKNNRIEISADKEAAWTRLVLSVMMTLLVYLVSILVFINLWSAYMYSVRKEIGVMRLLGIKDSYLYKKYWIKQAVVIILCMIVAVIVRYGVELYQKYQELSLYYAQYTMAQLSWNEVILYANNMFYIHYMIWIVLIIMVIVILGISFSIVRKECREDFLKQI